MVSCSYNGITCHAHDFTLYWDNNYGNCYTFNYGTYNATTSSYKKTSAHGSESGLKLELSVSKYKQKHNKTCFLG